MGLEGLECHRALRSLAEQFEAPQRFEEGEAMLGGFGEEMAKGSEVAGQVLYALRISGG